MRTSVRYVFASMPYKKTKTAQWEPSTRLILRIVSDCSKAAAKSSKAVARKAKASGTPKVKLAAITYQETSPLNAPDTSDLNSLKSLSLIKSTQFIRFIVKK